ncbi:DNA translocase FtsK [Bacillus pacificus]|uniref:DNA translocase FtsK n=4 Tax=Bacillus cereus group TaxID=86661 RepID=UPI001E618A59|nr:DNA translocase FtsK [Bacillus pacificus]MCU5417053.1 DNA translocase FtsK [Bacillus pacificus]MCU5731245.1 DNA translocase FtsK [Bacillus pacificus]MDF0737114.1 DNA translocase FtsK [Bacillus pacificus]UEP95450.1 DNA translocase FtsK [Bacillus pacificus]HDR7896009.1 DNA translocase FtsK [Bacillus pacificus]
MLDWMKKLFNKEEEQTAMNKEVQKQVESQPKIPRVNHYTEAREAQMASRNAGKCRFPLVPDNGFDEEDVIETGRFEEQPVQAVTYKESPIQRGIKVERSRRQYVEKVVSTYEEPEMQYEPEREPVVKKASTPAQESNRRPFRPTEMISPIYGYNRPSVEKKEEKQEEVKEREDLEISVEGKSVVDAWLEKKGYTLSHFSEGQAPTSSSHERVEEQDQQSKKEEKSVVDQWLEKNGYEIERQEPIVEEKEVAQEMSAPQEVPAAELLHETIAERMEDAKQEKDVVVENVLQTESLASKVEHEDTILLEEMKRNTEIDQPTIEVEKQAPEESVIVKAEEKLEETIIVEIPEEFEEVDVITETEESEEVEVIAEAEESEEVEVIAETEESEEVEVIAETEESEEVEVIAETEESEEVEVIAETEESEEVEVIAETEESEEVEVIAEAEESEEVEVIAETEESEEVEVIAEAEESEEVEVIAETKAPEEAEPVVLEETQQEMVLNEAIEQKNEFIHVAEADEQTKKDVQSFADVLIAEEAAIEEEQSVVEEAVIEEAVIEEEQPVVEEAVIEEEQRVVEETVIEEEQPVAEETPVVEEPPVVEEAAIEEEQSVVEETPVVEEQPVVEETVIEEEQPVAEETPVAEEPPVVQKEEPKREKKRHVPFNVVMLKQDRARLVERHAARTNAMQPSMKERVENKPVHQVEEQPMQQVVVEPQVEEQPMQQVAVEPQVEEQPMQQVAVEPQVEEQPMQQVAVEPQVEEQPMQQVVVEPQVEEQPMQQVVVEPQTEEQPMQQVVVEPQVEERPVQQVVVESQQVQKPISSTEVEEKAYVVNQRENDVRNVLQTPPTYTIPSLTLLSIPQQAALDNTEWLEEQKELLDTTFNNFHVGAHVINVSQGPAVTRFEVQPDPGVKVNKITNLSDDIKLSLAAKDIRIEAPIPGKSAIGIEVPNKESKPVFLREILRSPVFTKSESPLTVALGLDISGDPIVTDIRKMPHGLIAGATGSGKSVCINAILTSILYKAKPHEVKLMLIDPKMVELAPYNSVPHLVAPVITDVKAATAALKWAVEEMERRYELFAHAGARDLTRYNTIVSEREIPGETLPYIVIVIDELADLMMVAPGDVEEAICRIAQKARACGIHLLVATQRPSVDVITGLIKSNIPTRIAFTVSSQVDSRTIIDIGGAEKLLGRGDMLFLGNGTSKPVRVQGVYVSDDEIEKTVDHVKKQMKPNYLFKQEDLLAKTEQAESEDELFLDACQFVVEQGGASTSSVQRKFRIGYNRAARLIEEMESQGIISEGRGTKPRDVLISEDEFAAMQETNV